MCQKVRPRFRQQRALAVAPAEPGDPEAARELADMGRVEAARVEEMPVTAEEAQVAAVRWAPQWDRPEQEAVEDRALVSAEDRVAESQEDIRVEAVRLGTDPAPAGEVECPACPLSSPESAARRDLPALSS